MLLQDRLLFCRLGTSTCGWLAVFLLLLWPGRYVPTHLHQMLFELIKNSLRAVQERFADSDEESPPIRIVVADGLEDVTIKVGAWGLRVQALACTARLSFSVPEPSIASSGLLARVAFADLLLFLGPCCGSWHPPPARGLNVQGNGCLKLSGLRFCVVLYRVVLKLLRADSCCH